jgi:HEAT repeat protein
MTTQTSNAIESALDASMPPDTRLRAVRVLAGDGSPEAVAALMRLAANENAPEQLQAAAGCGLGEVNFRQGTLLDVLWRDFTGAADAAFDERVGELQQAQKSAAG